MAYKIPNTFLIVLYCFISLESLGCNKNKAPVPPPPDPCYYNGVDTCLLNAKTKIQVSLTEEKQTIHSFGASDCWTAKFIGRWTDESKKNKIADYLFSMDTALDGTPKGIALSQWRFNIGAGSFEQGNASEIGDEWRREECFKSSSGTYDWSKEQGAQWFLNAAKSRQVKYTLGFAVSPPVDFTLDGKAHGGGRSSFNIKPDKMEAYADFLKEVCVHFKFDYLSPFNEPQWNWGSNGTSQEGSAATNTEMANLVKLLGPKLQAAASSSKIVLGEAAQLNFITNNYETDRGNQISAWFSNTSSNYIGNVPNVENAISGHSYFTTCPDNTLIDTRTDLLNKRNSVNPSIGIWQSEFGILGDICGKYNGYPRNTSIDYGLYVAKVIHHDLVFANASSWSWWLAMSPYDYSDALVYVNDPSGNINVSNCKTDGIVNDSKQLWCMGNFSRFIRPGMKRVSASLGGIDNISAASGVMVSAYKDAASKQIVFVMINMGINTAKLTLAGSQVTIAQNKLDTYTTTGTKSLARSVSAADNILLEPKSVTTFVGKYQ